MQCVWLVLYTPKTLTSDVIIFGIPLEEYLSCHHHNNQLKGLLESTGDHTFEGESVHKAIYFAVIYRFVVEITARFSDILLAIATHMRYNRVMARLNHHRINCGVK